MFMMNFLDIGELNIVKMISADVVKTLDYLVSGFTISS